MVRCEGTRSDLPCLVWFTAYLLCAMSECVFSKVVCVAFGWHVLRDNIILMKKKMNKNTFDLSQKDQKNPTHFDNSVQKSIRQYNLIAMYCKVEVT